MKKIGCIIIGQESDSTEDLESHINYVKYIRLERSLNNWDHALEFLKNDQGTRLIFIICNEKGLPGKNIMDHFRSHLLVIIGSLKEQAYDAYENDAIDFILKPVTSARFLKAMKKVRNRIALRDEKTGTGSMERMAAERSRGKNKQKKYINSPLTEKEKNKLLADIIRFVENEKFYLNSGVTVELLAKRLQSNRTYVSQILNEKKGMNFHNFINEYRIREAIRLLSAPGFNNLSVEGIAFSIGFNSKSSFFSAFRKYTGTTPSRYLQLNQDKKKNFSLPPK